MKPHTNLLRPALALAALLGATGVQAASELTDRSVHRSGDGSLLYADSEKVIIQGIGVLNY